MQSLQQHTVCMFTQCWSRQVFGKEIRNVGSSIFLAHSNQTSRESFARSAIVDSRVFLNIDSGTEESSTTTLLSQKTLQGPCIPTPIISNFLYFKPSIITIAIRVATNSEPKVDDSTVFCRLENHFIGAQLTKIKTPVWERRVPRHPA